jgi:hypothetical protein
MKKNTIILAILSVVLLSSCSKEECCCIPQPTEKIFTKIDSKSFTLSGNKFPKDTTNYKVEVTIGIVSNAGGPNIDYLAAKANVNGFEVHNGVILKVYDVYGNLIKSGGDYFVPLQLTINKTYKILVFGLVGLNYRQLTTPIEFIYTYKKLN